MHALVGVHEAAQRVWIEAGVGVRDKRPGDAKYAGIPDERSVGEHRELVVESIGQVVADLTQLLINNKKIVDQPFSCGRDPTFLGNRFGNDVIRFAQHPAIFFYTRQQRSPE